MRKGTLWIPYILIGIIVEQNNWLVLGDDADGSY
jgi:hypothetical protein